MKVFGQLEKAQLEVVASSLLTSDPEGRVAWNSVSARLEVVDNGTAVHSLAKITDKLSTFAATTSAELAGVISDETGSGSLVFATSPTLANPVMSASAVMTQIATPASPSAGTDKIYTKSDGKLYVLNSSGVEKSTGGLAAWVGSTPYTAGDVVTYNQNTYIALSSHTSGSTFETDIQGGKWKLTNTPHIQENLVVAGNTFEDNDVGGWTATGCATITNGLPVSVGSGGAAFSSSNGGRAKGANTTAPAVTSSGAINGTYSLNFATSGAGTIGDGYISQIYNIPIKYQAKCLVAEVAFKVASGTPVMGGTSADTYAIAIYDPVNNSWLGNAGAFSFNQSTGVGIARTTFQTAYNTTGLQIFIYSPVAPTGASSLLLDDVSIYKQDVVYGSPVTDWQSYTPVWSSSGTQPAIGNGSLTGFWKRSGDSISIKLTLLAGSTTTYGTGTYFFSIPFSFDTTKQGNPQVYGDGAFFDASANSEYSLQPRFFAADGKVMSFLVMGPSTAGVTSNQLGGATVPVAMANADQINLNVWDLPIQGFSSNVVMSSDAAVNVVNFVGYNSASTSLPTTGTYIPFTTQKDDVGGWSNDTYTVRVPGDYVVNSTLHASSASNYFYAQVDKNGSLYKRILQTETRGDRLGSGSVIVYGLVAGDTLKIKGYSDSSAQNLNSTAELNHLSIQRISGPAQIASGALAVTRVSNSASTSYTSAGIVKMPASSEFDTTGSWATDTYTVPVSGKYRVTAMINGTQTTASINGYHSLVLYKNGSATSYISTKVYETTQSVYKNLWGSTVVDVRAGDTLDIRVDNNSGATYAANGVSSQNWIIFEKISGVY